MPTIKEMILSEDYADYILPIYPQFLEDYREFGAQLFNNYYGMIHGRLPSSDIRDYFANGLFYNTIPNLYSLLDTVSLEVSGITAVQNQPALNLKGRGILIGFIDTGLITHIPHSDGQTGAAASTGCGTRRFRAARRPLTCSTGQDTPMRIWRMHWRQKIPWSLSPHRIPSVTGLFWQAPPREAACRTMTS